MTRKDPNLLPSAEELAEMEAIKQQIRDEHRFHREHDLDSKSKVPMSPFSPRVFRFSSMRSSHEKFSD